MRLPMITIVTVAIGAGLVVYAGLGWWSHQSRFDTGGITDGHLAQCSASPNCVCSDHADSDDNHAIATLRLTGGSSAEHWTAIAQLVTKLGGTVQTDTGT